METAMLIRTRVLWPGHRPPIEDAAIAVAEDRVLHIGPWKTVRRHLVGPHLDLGESLILPGLINAHCHLDYTHMAGLLPPIRSFTDWIKSITALKGNWTDGEFADSWLAGAEMLLRSGTTTVADVEAVPDLLSRLWRSTPLRVISFLEMTGVRDQRNPQQILAETVARALAHRSDGAELGLSPHALYSTTSDLLRLSLRAARRHDWRLVTHVAESDEEYNMIRHARGPMFDWLGGSERDMSDCGRLSPVAQLDRLGYLNPRLIAIHLNYLARGDARRLVNRGVHAVHCPRSHDYFRHQEFPYTLLSNAGVNICLGTDSLLTVRKKRQPVALSLFEEMQAFARAHPNVRPEHILSMVTRNPARALGCAGKIGTLQAGASADLIVIPFVASPSQAAAAAVDHQQPVAASLIRGHWAIPPDNVKP